MLSCFALSFVILKTTPQKMFCYVCVIFAVEHILTDLCDFFTHTRSSVLLRWQRGIQSMTYFRHFHHKYLTKTFPFLSVFHVNWYKLTSKPSGANSGTYANIDLGIILNMGFHHMQCAVSTSNQSNNVNMWFAPLIKNTNLPLLTFMYT